MTIKELKKLIEEKGEFKADLVAMVTRAETLPSAKGSSYWSIDLTDKTGDINLKKWDVEIRDNSLFVPGNVITFKGLTTQLYKGTSPSIQMKKGASADFSTEDPNNFKRTVIKDYETLKKEFDEIRKLITDNDCNKLLDHLFEDENFFVWPAAERMHHNCKHGLLAHSINVARQAYMICRANVAAYGQCGSLNQNILLTSALIHDYFKIEEYSVDENYVGKVNRTVLTGGHIIACVQYLEHLRMSGFFENEETCFRIKHCVLSHHGKPEWGSPQAPSTLEACILHWADNIDAKSYTVYEGTALLEPGEMDKQKNFMTESRLYNPY